MDPIKFINDRDCFVSGFVQKLCYRASTMAPSEKAPYGCGRNLVFIDNHVTVPNWKETIYLITLAVEVLEFPSKYFIASGQIGSNVINSLNSSHH